MTRNDEKLTKTCYIIAETIFLSFYRRHKMTTVKAYYDGNAFVPMEKVSFKIQQTATIVLDDEESDSKAAKSCKGIAASYANPRLIPLEESAIGDAFSGGQ